MSSRLHVIDNSDALQLAIMIQFDRQTNGCCSTSFLPSFLPSNNRLLLYMLSNVLQVLKQNSWCQKPAWSHDFFLVSKVVTFAAGLRTFLFFFETFCGPELEAAQAVMTESASPVRVRMSCNMQLPGSGKDC